MTPIDSSAFTRLNVKVSRVTCKNVNMGFADCLSIRAFVLHRLINIDRDMPPIGIGLIRSEGQKDHFCKEMDSPYLIFLRTVYHRSFIFYVLIGFSEGLTPINFVKVTRVTFVKNSFRSCS